MFNSLPDRAEAFQSWEWEQIAPYYDDLWQRPLTPETIKSWLDDWSILKRLIMEVLSRLRVANTLDTTDEVAEANLQNYLKLINVPSQKAENELIKKLLDSGLIVEGMELPLKKMRSEAELFAEENLLLFTDEVKLSSQYNRIIGTQTVSWEGEEKTLTQMRVLFDNPDRDVRETIWRKISSRQLEDRQKLNELWQQLLILRQQIAENAGYDNFLDYRWKVMKRFDYTPADSEAFRDAIEQEVVPVATKMYQQFAAELDVDSLRPWDVSMDISPLLYPKLEPVQEIAEIEPKTSAMFQQVGDVFGNYFETMRREDLLDVPNRNGKAPGAYCTYFAVEKRPFIFMNAVGTANDIRTMLHEAGHAFHAFESNHLPYPQQRHPGFEFSEVASMGMELLASPYLEAQYGGFYDSSEEAARHRVDHLRRIVAFWPYMAVVDGFQHWVYRHVNEAQDPANCDAKWAELWQRFMPGVNWAGFEDEMVTGWHRKQHIFRAPLYYVEYGMAQVGAIQVWRNALADKETAVRQYRHALAQGGTKTLPELYALAGGEFKFDNGTMREVVGLLSSTMAQLAN